MKTVRDSHVEKNSHRFAPSFETWFAAALGLALLAAAWSDMSTYRVSRGKAHPDFPFLSVPGELRLGNVELYRAHFTLIQMENFGEIEHDGRRPFRHALGPEAVIEMTSQSMQAHVSFQFFNAIAGQNLSVSWNGQTLEQLNGIPEGTLEKSYSFALRPGVNRFAISFARYNHSGVELAAGDSRSIAGTFFSLDLALN